MDNIKVKALKNFGYANKARKSGQIFDVRKDHFEVLRKVYFVEPFQEQKEEKKDVVVENKLFNDTLEKETLTSNQDNKEDLQEVKETKTKKVTKKRARKKNTSED